VQFHCSQHWPFPAGSLMSGCFALTEPDARPDPCNDEVEEARWFSPKELLEALERVEQRPMLRVEQDNIAPDHVFIPPSGAIAHHLIKAWLKRHGHLS
jgi:NAD+ diphosphatase